MFLTRLSVDRPVTTFMASLIVVLLGVIALSRLPIDLLPEMTYPTVSVITLYRGAGPEEVETLITRPIEQALSSVNRVERLSSSSSEGGSTVRVQLQWGTDIDAAIANMRQSIAKIRNVLPDEIDEPYIRQYDVADRPIIYLGLTSDLDPTTVARIAETQVVPQLERLDGVARVSLRGSVRREIHVKIDRGELEARNLPVSEVVAALQRENVTQPGGDVQEGFVNLLVESDSEYSDLSEIARTIVRRQGNAVVRIDDVAEVVDGHERRREMTRTNGEPAVMVYIFRQSGANTIQVSDRVRQAVGELNEDLRSAHITLRTDRAEFIRQAVANVKTSAIFGMGLAAIILVLFLRSFRSAFVISISMPLSVLATFIAMYFLGFTLNVVSFGGLALGIGMLVDNSIVVLESIFRKRNEGVDPRRAAIEGTAEVSSAIVASTLTTLIVFIPILFIHGITGLLLHQLAWVVSVSLVCSLFASLTLTPMLTTLWSEVGDSRTPHDIAARWFHGLTGSVFAAFQWCYVKLFEVSLRHTGIVLFLLLICFTCVVGLYPFVGAEFLPATDEGNLYVNCEMAAGIQLPMLAKQSELLEKRVFELVPERTVTAAFIGDGADDGEDWHKSRLRVQLLPRSQRKRSIDEIRRDLEENLGVVPGTKTSVRVFNDSMLFRSYGGNDAAIEVVVRGHNADQAGAFSEAIQLQMEQVVGLVNVEVERAQERPIIVAKIDRAKAGLQGVSVRDIAQTLETTIRGAEATVYREDGDEYNVLVQLQETDRNQQGDVNLLGVGTASGAIVPLQSIVDFKQQRAPVSINRADQQRMVVVSADVEDRDLDSAVKELRTRLHDLEVPLGFSYQITGDWEQQQESFNALLQGFVLAILLMYMVMASQFESLRDPVVIMVSVPLGAIGVILVFVLTPTTLNVQSFIGVIMLAGIVVNNAIVLVDYMNQLARNSPELSIDEVVRQASVRRFRPIVMTALTTVLAMLPIALGLGEGGELQAPLARVVIGGLATGTLTTLFAIPLIYRAVHRTSQSAPES